MKAGFASVSVCAGLAAIVSLCSMTAAVAAAGSEPALKPVVAVFDVESDGIDIPGITLDRLTKYLGIRLTMGGVYQVIPESAIKSAMVALKIESQKDCYDESCRVKLGNEVAAQKNLNVTVWKVGQKCRIVAALFDLRTATSEDGAEASGLACDEESLMAGIAGVAQRLSSGRGSPVGGTVSGPLAPAPVAGSEPVTRTGSQPPPPVKAENGYLSIEGNPRGARVDISGPSDFGVNGTVATSLPVPPMQVPAGLYRVAVSMNGFDTFDRNVRVYADATELVKVELEKSEGEIRISGSPEGARSHLECENGFERDFGLPSSPWSVNVPRGSCSLKVERDGYESYEESFDVDGGGVRDVEVELARQTQEDDPDGGQGAADKVVISLHMMSQCPFAAQVVRSLAEASAVLGDSFGVNVDYIGDESTPGALTSMHGNDEVTGDLYGICAKKYSPSEYLGFLACMAADIKGIPGNFESCAGSSSIDTDGVRECAEGGEGRSLLSDSFRISKAKDARGSPTMFVNGVKYTGGRTALDFERAVCDAIAGDRPDACAGLPDPLDIAVTVIQDRRCKECQADRVAGQLKGMFPGMKFSYLDYSDAAGRRFYDSLKGDGVKLLPAFLIDPAIVRDPGYSQISRFIVDAGPYKLLQIGAKFDPEAEICDNGIDDDHDGRLDCNDRDCSETVGCRREVPGRLELFVMSKCPFAARAVTGLNEFMRAFRRDRVSLSINFIAEQLDDGSFKSLHGEREVDEDIRQVCAMKHYASGNKYLEYVVCRAGDTGSDNWQNCARNGISSAVIGKCFNDGEGRRLLADNIKKAIDLKIGASPTWIANSKHTFSGIDVDAIRKKFCEHNSGMAGCSTR